MLTRNSLVRSICTPLISLLLALPCVGLAADEVNVYSYRQPYLIEPMFDAFTESTGIKVNTVFAKKGLIERLASEGANSPADLLLSVDVGRLTGAVNLGITQPVDSDTLSSNIPAEFRSPDNQWFGLSNRARLIVVSNELADDLVPASYEDLAKPALAGRICTRSGKHEYMVALIASMMVHHGDAAAQEWLTGVRANLARKPQGNDRAQVKAITQGECDIAVINSYYIGAMLAEPEQAPWVEQIKLVFPNQSDRGTHLNISGMSLTAAAPNRENAIKLMEFLSSNDAQTLYADVNNEYPINPNTPWSELTLSWGTFKHDPLALAELAPKIPEASKLVDIVGYDR